MKPLELVINYEPVAKGRPKFAMKNGASWSYTPTKTQEAQEKIQAFLRKKIKDNFPPHIGLKMTVIFYRTKSRWLPKKETIPFRKPDLVNFEALLDDAFGMRRRKTRDGVIEFVPILPDDAQITSCYARKRWSKNGHGYIVVKIEEDDGNEEL